MKGTCHAEVLDGFVHNKNKHYKHVRKIVWDKTTCHKSDWIKPPKPESQQPDITENYRCGDIMDPMCLDYPEEGKKRQTRR